MTVPAIHPYPVKRPGFISEANWVGNDPNLKLQLKYTDEAGALRVLEFETRNMGSNRKGEVCIPTSNDLNNLGPRARDVLVAHTRMACMITGVAVPGSMEFADAFIAQEGSANLQTALGTTKVSSVSVVDDQIIRLGWKVGSGPEFTDDVGHTELNLYQFTPDTQLLIVPGAVKKQFPTYVHDYPGTILSEARKDEISAYVLGLAPWI